MLDWWRRLAGEAEPDSPDRVPSLPPERERAVGLGGTSLQSVGTFSPDPGPRPGFWARLTGASTPYYSWEERFWSGTVWGTPDPARSGVFNARELNDTPDLPTGADDGLIVWMTLSDGPLEEGAPWLFQACPPPQGDAPGSGDGPGSGPGSNPPPTPPGGACPLAKLRKSDCVLATGLGQEIKLANTGTRWTSPTPLDYGSGTGTLEFWYELGRLHLSLAGRELLDCGDGCFSGGPLTGHPDEDAGAGSGSDSGSNSGSGPGSGIPTPCSGVVFTICLACASCADEPDPGPPPPPAAVPCCPGEGPDPLLIPGRLYAVIEFTGGAGHGACSTTVPIDRGELGRPNRWSRFFHYPCASAWLGEWYVFIDCVFDEDAHVWHWIYGLTANHGYPFGGCGGGSGFLEVTCAPFFGTTTGNLTQTCFTGDPADAGTPVPFTITFTETPP